MPPGGRAVRDRQGRPVGGRGVGRRRAGRSGRRTFYRRAGPPIPSIGGANRRPRLSDVVQPWGPLRSAESPRDGAGPGPRRRGGPVAGIHRFDSEGFSSNRDWVRTIAHSSGKVWNAWIARVLARASTWRWLIGGGASRLAERKRWKRPSRAASSGHLLAEVAEDLEVDPLDVDAALVFDQAARAEVGRPLVAEVAVEEEAGFGQDGLGAGEDLGEADGAGAEQHGMPALDDPQVGPPAAVLDPAERLGGEPVGMHGTAEDLERQVGDPRSPGAHTHECPGPFRLRDDAPAGRAGPPAPARSPSGTIPVYAAPRPSPSRSALGAAIGDRDDREADRGDQPGLTGVVRARKLPVATSRRLPAQDEGIRFADTRPPSLHLDSTRSRWRGEIGLPGKVSWT